MIIGPVLPEILVKVSPTVKHFTYHEFLLSPEGFVTGLTQVFSGVKRIANTVLVQNANF